MKEDIKTLLCYLTDFIARFEEECIDLYDLDRDQAMRNEIVDIQRKHNLHRFEK